MANEINAVAGQLWGIPMGEVYTAGPGIKIDNVHKVVSVDETVLYDGSTSGTSGDVTLSEVITNFERIGIFYSMNHAYLNGAYNFGGKWMYLDPADLSVTKKFNINDFGCDGNASNTMVIRSDVYTVSNDLTKFVHDIATQMFFNGTSWAVNTTQHAIMYKIVGINRKSA